MRYLRSARGEKVQEQVVSLTGPDNRRPLERSSNLLDQPKRTSYDAALEEGT
jgi:hypothetical protein